MGFVEYLNEQKPKIWKEIESHLPKDGPFNYAEVVSEYPERKGKYGRGGLVLLSCEAFGGDVSKAIRTAAAMQISEDWLLIHDDVEDNSEMRRGKPALHRIYGTELAINAGDALHLLMWKMLLDNRELLGEQKTFRIMEEFYRFLDITARGQHLETYTTLHRSLEELVDKDFEEIAYGKSAVYTIAGPLRLGAIIADQPEETSQKLDEVGIPLGIAFQIRDDILNIVGQGNSYGKEIGGDIYEGKRTLLLIHLVKNTQGEEHRKVLEIMSKPREKKTESEVGYIIELMKEKGSVDYAEKRAAELANLAKENFRKYFSHLPNRELFEAAIDFFALKRQV